MLKQITHKLQGKNVKYRYKAADHNPHQVVRTKIEMNLFSEVLLPLL